MAQTTGTQGQVQAQPSVAPPVANQFAEPGAQPFTWQPGELVFSFVKLGERLRFRHLLPAGVTPPLSLPPASELSDLEVSLLCTGEDVPDHHGAKFTGALPGTRLVFAGQEELATAQGKQLVLRHKDPILSLEVQSHYESFGAIPVVRRFTQLRNLGRGPIGVEYLSSAMLNNLAAPATFGDDLLVHHAWNSWQAEADWRSETPADVGLVQNGNFSVSGFLQTTVGSWPCESVLPLAMVENRALGVIWFWQVEHPGSWHAELAQTATRSLYAYLGGPDAPHAQAWKDLRAGDMYETVPVAVGCVRGGFGEAVAALTEYRRATHRFPRRDMVTCPVVFNDAVPLGGDTTTAKELALIETAAEIGCEVFCVDAGWSARPGQNWWGAVGDWEPDPQRYPGGFREVTDAIRSKGMLPGLWIEPEVAGMSSRLARRPDDWFLVRHGRRVLDHSRYHLDFRNPEVRAYTDAVFARLLGDYGIGYIKLDYNINAREGTELHSESFGQGLLGHNRAFLSWLDGLLSRYPELTLETVASGSMRMEGSMLSRGQLQSISDGDDYRLYSSMVVGASAVVLPEQMGVWSQPMPHDTPTAVSCNMVNAMLGRIHQSGFIGELSPAGRAQVREGIRVYKEQIRGTLPRARPFYPLGLPQLTRPARGAALGMRAGEHELIAVWRREGPATVRLPGRRSEVRLLYPSGLGVQVSSTAQGIEVTLPEPHMACVVATGRA